MGGSKSSLGFLVLLLIVLFSGTSSDPRSQVFLSCECAMAKIKNMCLLGEEVKSMNARETQTDTLRDTGDLFKEQMPDVTPEKHIDKVASGPLPPQANKTCWQKDNGHISGQLCLINGCCRVYHPGGRQMKGKWENNRTVTFKVFKENCQLCYQAFLERCEKMLKTTAPPTTVPPTVPPTAPPISHVIWIAPGVLVSFVIMGIVAWILYKKRAFGVGSANAFPPLPPGFGNPMQPLPFTEPPHPGNEPGDCVPRKPLTGALLASGLSLCLASFVLLLFTLEPRDQTLGIPSLSTSYADTVAAPSRVSCEI